MHLRYYWIAWYIHVMGDNDKYFISFHDVTTNRWMDGYVFYFNFMTNYKIKD